VITIDWRTVRELVRLGLSEITLGDLALIGEPRLRLLVCARARGAA
jgi:hypothetical protein